MHTLPSQPHPRVWIHHALPLVNLGLASALRDRFDLEVIEGAAAGPRDGAPPVGPVDVAVLDHAAGLRLAAEQRGERAPQGLARARVLVVTGSDREAEVRQALAAGVHGYLLHDCSADELVQAVQALARGGRHLCHAAALRMAESLAYQALTPRELQVLRLLVEGHANKTIASTLSLSIGTVKAHLKHVLSKLGAQSRTQAIGVAVQRGLVGEARTVASPMPAGLAAPSPTRAQPVPTSHATSPTAARTAARTPYSAVAETINA